MRDETSRSDQNNEARSINCILRSIKYLESLRLTDRTKTNLVKKQLGKERFLEENELMVLVF